MTKTQRQSAESHYDAIANWIENTPPGSILHSADVKMIPFGGLGTDTVSKPIKYDEYDLDLVIQLLIDPSRINNAFHLYNSVGERIREHGTYREIYEGFDRCHRLNYSGNFHMDLMPAIRVNPHDNNDSRIWVPEKGNNGLFRWVLVDPVGLMKWFNKQTELQQREDHLLVKARGDFEKMPIPSEEVRTKPALKQVVQLLKRARDVYFEKDEDCKKILKSVIIQTVAGSSYDGERLLSSLFPNTLYQLRLQLHDRMTCKVINPLNEDEDFAESLRKHPDRHDKLWDFLTHLNFHWKKLTSDALGFSERAKVLSLLFGENPTQAVTKEYGERMHQLNMAGGMKVNSQGTIGYSSASAAGLSNVSRHQFFGDKF